MKHSGTALRLAHAAMLAALLNIGELRGSAMQGATTDGVADQGSCPLPLGHYEAQGYRVRRVQVRGVFDAFQLLPSTAARVAGVELPAAGSRFTVQETVAAARALEERLHRPFPGSDSPFALTLVISNIERCSDSGGQKQLDVRYRTLTSRLPALTGVTVESKDAQHADPAAAAGALAAARVKVAPAAAYNPSDGLQGGGTLSIRQLSKAIDSVDAHAIGSTRSHLVRVTLGGSNAPRMPGLDRGDWRLSFNDEEQAGTPGERFATNAFKGQWTGQTLPLGSGGGLFRFGGGVEGGHQEATLRSGAGVAGDRTEYEAVRAAGGFAIAGRRYAAAASYGLLLGHVPGEPVVSYRKQVADLAWNADLPLADHLPLHVDARVNAGWLLGADAAPLAERFRGGNREEFFFEGGSWAIHSNPLLRSVPSNQLGRTAPDPSLGADRFVAINLTASLPVWRYPLIPRWLSQSSGFKSGIAAARETGRNQAVVYYQSQDPAQKLMADDATRLRAVLDTVFASLTAAQGTVDPDRRDAFDECVDAADTARDKMARLKDTGFGPIATNIVPGVTRACDAELAASLPSATLAAPREELEAIAASIAEKQTLIRTDLAQAKADADLKFAFTAMDTFINEVNAVAIGPVVAFDAARLDPRPAADAAGLRYGIGLGARVSIVNVLHLTALYAWNPSPSPAERRGAWLMSLTLTDLLR